MSFVRTCACLVFAATISGGSLAWAQCQGGQRGGQSAGNMNSLTNSPYNQFPLNSGYNLNTLGNQSYSQQALAPFAAMDQYSRNMRTMAAMQVQYQSQSVRNQVAQAQAMRKEMAKASAEKRKAAQQEKAENLALRQERESAKRNKLEDPERVTMRLTSVQ